MNRKSIEAFGQDPKGLDGEATKATVPEGHAPNTVANTVTVDLEKRLEALLAELLREPNGLRKNALTIAFAGIAAEALPLLLTQLREYRTALEARPAMPEREAIAQSRDERSISVELLEAANLLEGFGDMDLRDACREAAAILSATTGDVREAAPEREGDGLFHVSRSSDGTNEWFSIRDAASGVTFRAPDQERDQAHALARSLNRAVRLYVDRLSLASPPSAHDMREAAREALEKVKRLAYGYELMHTAICHMAGTSGADARWYMAKAQEVQSRVAPVWGITKESNASKPGDCMHNYLNAVPNLAALAPMDAVKAAVEAEWQDIAREAEFLVNRIDELDWSATFDDLVRDWAGHVCPPLSRLRKLLSAIRARAGGAK